MYARFRELLARRSGQLAVSNELHEITYGELARQVEALRRLLDAGPGPVVILLALRGGPQFTVVELAALAAGAIVAPIPTGTTAGELRSYLGLIKPDLVVAESTSAAAAILAELDEPAVVLQVAPSDPAATPPQVLAWDQMLQGGLEPIRPASVDLPEDTAWVQFTSGSTSQPKGILLSAGNLLANQVGNVQFLSHFTDTSVFCPVPQFHAMGRAVVFEHLLSGSPVHLANRFFPGDDLARMRRHACTAILASPNYVRLLIRFGALRTEHLPDLKTVVLGTSPVDASLVADLREHLPGVDLHIRYGVSESAGVLTRHDVSVDDDLSAPDLIGLPVPGIEIAQGLPRPGAMEPGKIRVRGGAVGIGQLLARGEWKPLVDADGFLATGDLACQDASGRIHLRGRTSTFLKSDGYRVNPFEIEGVLREIPGVLEAVVVGVPDPLSGERIVACVESVSGAAELDMSDLKAHCESSLSTYKVPREFRRLAPLPRTPAGKPDRQRIASLLAT